MTFRDFGTPFERASPSYLQGSICVPPALAVENSFSAAGGHLEGIGVVVRRATGLERRKHHTHWRPLFEFAQPQWLDCSLSSLGNAATAPT